MDSYVSGLGAAAKVVIQHHRESLMKRPPVLSRLLAAFALVFVSAIVFADSASAHVKWFCAYNVAGQPVGLEQVLCPDFEYLVGVSILALMVGALFERTRFGIYQLNAIARVTYFIDENAELMFRAGGAFFFIAIWGFGGIILTPELKTNSAVVGAIQLMIAAGLLWRPTMPLSALGIVALFLIGIWNYGLFHMADYPIFLGIAAYIALAGLQRDFFGIKAIDIVRWSAGITLMWASIEKWAYPEWSFPLFAQHPDLTMGFDPMFFMRAAGAIEFALAFSLMWTPLVRRVGAILLLSMFVSAIFQFGKVDMIGHSMIIVVLLAIAAERREKSELVRYPWLVPFSYAGALTIFLATYYVAHSVIYGTSIS